MMTWALRAVLAILLLGVLLVGSLLLLEPQFDLSPYRAWIAQRLAASSGREIRIDGAIRIAFGRHARLSVHDIEVANPDWAGHGPLLRAGEISVGIDLMELLSATIHLDQVRFRNASVSLEVSEKGERSWQFGDPPTDSAVSKDAGGPAVVVEDVRIEDVAVAYHDPAAARPVLLRLDHVGQRNDRGMLVLDGAGEVNGLALQLNGRVGTLDALLRGRDIEVDLSASLDDMVLTGRGRLGQPAELEDIDLHAELRGPGLASLLNAFGIEYDHRGDTDLTLKISDLPRGFSWTSSGHIGGLDIATKGTVGRPLAFDDLQVEVDLNGQDLATLGQLAGLVTMPHQPYRVTGRITRKAAAIQFDAVQLVSGDARMRLHGRLPAFPQFDKAAVSLQVDIPQSQLLAGLAGRDVVGLAPLEISATLTPMDDGKEVLEAAVRLGGHRATLEGPVGRHPDYRDTRLAFAQSGPSIGALAAAAAGVDGLPHDGYRLAGSLAINHDGVASLNLPEGVIGPLHITSSGTLGSLPHLAGMDLKLRVSGTSLRALVAAPEGARLPDLPFELDTRLSGDAPAISLTDSVVTVGEARLTTRGRVGMPPALTGTDVTFKLHIPELARLLPAAGPADWVGGRYRASGRLRRTDDGVELLGTEIVGDRFHATADGTLPASLSLDGATLAIRADAPDLAAIMPPIAGYHPPASPVHLGLQLRGRKSILDVEELALQLADAHLTGKGHIALAAEAGPARFDLEARVAKLSNLGRFDAVVLADDPLQLHAVLTHRSAITKLENLSLRIGDGEARGTLTVQQRNRPLVDLDLVLHGIDFRRLLIVRTSEQAATQPSADPDAPVGSGDRPEPAQAAGALIPAGAPELDFLFAIDGSLRVRGDALHYPDPKFSGSNLVETLAVEAQLHNGNLLLKELSVDGERGRFRFSGRLDYLPQALVLQGQLQADRVHGGLLASGRTLEELPKHAVNLELSAQGRTYRQLVESLNGTLHMTGGGGRTSNTELDKTMGSFSSQLLSDVNPFSKTEPFTRIECSAAAGSIENGKLILAPGLVVRTDKLDVSAHGTIDLSNEQIDIQFRNAPRAGIGLSAAGVIRPFIKVGGTLSRPGITLDTSGALLSGTAAVATGGLSIVAVGLLDRFSTADNPCARVVAEAQVDKKAKSAKPVTPLKALGRLLRGGLPGGDRQDEDEAAAVGPH